MRRFLPSARTTNWLITVGFLALGYAFYLRYLVIENTPVGLACDAGAQTTVCLVRLVATRLFNAQVFGWVALGAALINLMRPNAPMFALGLAAAALGVVLYNAGLAGLAAGLLVLSLARPVREEA
ncbi:hypothetical protein GJ689_08115 [Rhodoplanes serenus]|jgi:hypothetical protein|uniref:Uncharacterized protein n=1 Tax=Rhodoplanes serenus TaxID=200615 RepID=A0A327JRE6_9BRAD|nr:hypothetical protein [Rhodoplanes serenus]MBI5112912.1 hypothetical protein [Rhodovulum sp.]MTW16171.1 hypothetical protein [Rhodoplanes serenus]RAI27993.1 hypothetical protein CH340_23895 [Rhodoplanes serenus]VCU09811.1 hypothetical protein RHODGE_RHODGE_02982 [Rhodoplanes serenus]